ncbi:MAG: TIGR03667 family PPOX class F420-dependent oxidoreductase [Chloroflexi bacterium]|nr:TIGR03667 family PPOX class F420-dependent oxidoreductase [Chloroflexota bacterium]
MQIDTTTEFGQRVARRLNDEVIGWLTTVDASGTPQPRPVWFLWDGEALLIYSQDNQAKLRHLAANPKASINLHGDEHGGDIVVLLGEAAVDPAAPPSNAVPAYQAKYGRQIVEGLKMTPESFAADYPVAIRFRPTRLRGF